MQIPCGPLGPGKSLLNPLSLESSVQICYLIQSGNSGTSGADNYSTSPYVSPLSLWSMLLTLQKLLILFSPSILFSGRRVKS